MRNRSKSGSGMVVNGAGVPIRRGKGDSSRKYVAFLVFDATWYAGFLRNSLKLQCGFGIITLELYRSASQ